MKSKIGRWDVLVRQILLISLLFMLYAGPATAIGLDRMFDDEMFGESSPGEWAILVFVVWLFALPFWAAYAQWNNNPGTSATWLAAIVGLVALFAMVGFPVVRLAALLVFPAVSLPFSLFNIPSPSEDVALRSARIIAFGLLVGIPLLALVFQVIRINHKSRP